jgi:outer membrane lipoprotein-sorting protein
MNSLNCKYFGAVLLAATMLLSGCATQRQASASKSGAHQKQAATINDANHVKEVNVGFRTLSMDKTTFTLVNASGNQTSLNGSIRIARDSIIICSITPFLGVNMEFARIAINKQGVTIMDRINKRYFSCSFAEAQARFGMAMNYNAFESIFTDRVFIYNSPYIPLQSDFKVTNIADQVLFARSDDKVSQEFYFDNLKKLIGGMISAGNQYSMRWSYSDFAQYNSVNFPKQLSLKIAGPDFHRQVDIQYKNVELDRDRNFEFKIPASYKQVTMDELLGSF